MKNRAEQRAEILNEMRKLDKLHRETVEYRRGKGIEIDPMINISGLQDIILKAMEIAPAISETHTEWAKLSRRGKARKVSWKYEEFSTEQRAIADKVIRNMANQGYIELALRDAKKNIWRFKVLRTF